MYIDITDPIASLLGSWASQICFWSILLRLLLAVVLGAIIGCERATKRHAAGLRTFILTVMAPAIAMMVDLMWTQSPFPALSAAALIGIAILSSNSVLFSSKSQIKGLTTSVALWTCGIEGVAIGAGQYTLSILGFAALMCSLSVFPSFEKHLKDRSNHFEIHLELNQKVNLQDFVTTIRKLGLRIDDIESNPAYINSGLSVYSVSLTVTSPELKKYKRHDEIIEALRTLEYVHDIEEL